MENFFGKANTEYVFKLWSFDHWLIIIIFLGSVLSIYLFKDSLKKVADNKKIRFTIGSIMILLQMSYGMNNIYNGIGSIEKDLPLSLCGAAMILSGILMFTYNKQLFSILYFWSIAGVSQALITPNLGHYGPYHFRFYQFTFGHIGVIWVILFILWVKEFKINYKDIFRSLRYLCYFSVVVLAFNLITGANYLYLMKPPAIGSLLDLFPRFPWNLPVILVIALVYFYIAYLPFFLRNIIYRVRNQESFFGEFTD
jgi:hypothetical integral membrane protein (TIGR02206 family)